MRHILRARSTYLPAQIFDEAIVLVSESPGTLGAFLAAQAKEALSDDPDVLSQRKSAYGCGVTRSEHGLLPVRGLQLPGKTARPNAEPLRLHLRRTLAITLAVYRSRIDGHCPCAQTHWL